MKLTKQPSEAKQKTEHEDNLESGHTRKSNPGTIDVAARTLIDGIPVSQLKVIGTIGGGAYATVEKAVHSRPNGEVITLAIKRLRSGVYLDDREVEGFYQEVDLLSALQAPGIVQYYGTAVDGARTEGNGRILLLQEYMNGGSLKNMVIQQMLNRAVLYTDLDALRWCTQVATALRHLHSATPAVIHRDLKLDNILLTGSEIATMNAKICDFGLSVVVDHCYGPVRRSSLDKSSSYSPISIPSIHRSSITRRFLMSGQTGSLMYMAPEVFNHLPYNHKSDVFSFGVVMYELFYKYATSAAVCRDGTVRDLEQHAARVASGYRPILSPQRLPPALNKLISSCWAQAPEDRPDMADVVEQLEQIAQSGALTRLDQTKAEKVHASCFCLPFWGKSKTQPEP